MAPSPEPSPPIARSRLRRRRAGGGFTLLEVLVVLALVVILAAVGIPYTLDTIQRANFLSAVNCTANLMRVARLQAIRQNANIAVSVDGRILRLETGQAHAPNCQMPAVVDAIGVDGFLNNGGEPVFLPNGSGVENGSFRFTDQRGNLLEVRLEPAAVGRVEVRKFDGSSWIGRDQGGWTWL